MITRPFVQQTNAQVVVLRTYVKFYEKLCSNFLHNFQESLMSEIAERPMARAVGYEYMTLIPSRRGEGCRREPSLPAGRSCIAAAALRQAGLEVSTGSCTWTAGRDMKNEAVGPILESPIKLLNGLEFSMPRKRGSSRCGLDRQILCLQDSKQHARRCTGT
jgi:hypothetical protein